MKKLFVLSSFFLLLPCLVRAQLRDSYPRSLQIAIEALSVNADFQDKSPVIRYSALYTQPLSNTRWVVESGLSFTDRYTKDRFYTSNVFWVDNSSQLVTVDLTFLFNLLASKRHTIYVGAGPSLWLLRNGNTYDVTGVANQSGVIESVSYRRAYTTDFNIGVNLRAKYEYSVTSRIVAGIRFGLGGNLLKGTGEGTLYGSLLTVGASAGYRF